MEASGATEPGSGVSRKDRQSIPEDPRALEPLWAKQARQWELIKSPLRPSVEDLDLAQGGMDRWCDSDRRPLEAVVLGATAEYASLRWPAGSQVTAVDLSAAMLQHVWMKAPGDTAGRQAVEGNWLRLPWRAGSVDLVLGDGSFSLVRRDEGEPLARRLRMVLREDGLLLLRAYVRPESPETPESVCARLLAGGYGSFHIFKLRLLMSLQRGSGEVWVADAWECFRAHAPPPEDLASRLGWCVDEVRTIESYRGQDSVYWFPTLGELRAVLGPTFAEEACEWPQYEMGECCPSLTLKPRDHHGGCDMRTTK